MLFAQFATRIQKKGTNLCQAKESVLKQKRGTLEAALELCGITLSGVMCALSVLQRGIPSVSQILNLPLTRLCRATKEQGA